MKKIAVWAVLIMMMFVSAGCNLPVPGTVDATATLPPFPTADGNLTIPSTGSTCLVGDWQLADMDKDWLSGLASRVSEREVVVDEIEGIIGVQFRPDGGALIYTRDARLSARVPYQSARLPVTVTIDGEVEGSYDASQEGILTLSDPDVSDLNFSAHVLFLTVMSGKADDFLGRSVGSSDVDLDYICSGNSLVFTFDAPGSGEETVQLNRVQP